METLYYVLLGIIQGFTEPLPISSSGHLLIFKKLLNVEALNDLNFEIIVNFGSLLAIVFLYRKKIWAIIKDFFSYLLHKDQESKTNFKYAWLVALATIPAGIAGILFKDKIEEIFANTKFVGMALLVTALALFLVRKVNGHKNQKEITFLDALKVGIFQAFALLPGLSRSGATIVGGLSSDLEKETAIDFSFMLYIPISVATMILGISDLLKTPNLKDLLLPYGLGMVASFIMTYFSAKWFINILKKNKLIYFVFYCLIVGTLVLIFM